MTRQPLVPTGGLGAADSDDWYGNQDYPPGTQVVVHEPPQTDTFTEALKTGLGLGIGLVGVFTAAALIGRALR